MNPGVEVEGKNLVGFWMYFKGTADRIFYQLLDVGQEMN